MRIVILGAGRVGAMLADRLSHTHEVTLVDQDETAFRRLSPQYAGRTVVGNGIDVDVLRSAGTVGADIFLAVTNGDNRNLMAAQVAKVILGANRVVARIYDPIRAGIYRDLGLHTICPTEIGSQRLFDNIVSA